MHNWPEQVLKLVRLALEEDIGTGDITTAAIYSGKERGTARLVSKENGVLAGLDLAGYVLRQIDKKVVFSPFFNNGDLFRKGDIIAEIRGSLVSVLMVERTMLNFLQRMCGIATQTHTFTKLLASTHTKILDTRKTVPGHRYLDKLAVRMGGGLNHRFCLDDRFLIKENHIRMSGGIEEAISRCLKYRDKYNMDVSIEVEVNDLNELDKVVSLGRVDYVMLDNMNLDDMKEAVQRINGKFYTEASGNVTLDRLSDISGTGVDFISSGALTHSVKALDISLLVDL